MLRNEVQLFFKEQFDPLSAWKYFLIGPLTVSGKVISMMMMIVVAQYALPELDQLATAAPADGDRRFTGQPKLRQVMTNVCHDLSHGSDIKDIWDVFSHSSSLCQGSSQPSNNVT